MKSVISPKSQESVLQQKDIKNILQILAKNTKDKNEKLVKKGESKRK
jgi:hypothetical protein